MEGQRGGKVFLCPIGAVMGNGRSRTCDMRHGVDIARRVLPVALPAELHSHANGWYSGGAGDRAILRELQGLGNPGGLRFDEPRVEVKQFRPFGESDEGDVRVGGRDRFGGEVLHLESAVDGLGVDRDGAAEVDVDAPGVLGGYLGDGETRRRGRFIRGECR